MILSLAEMQADLDELVRLLETSHPDPYSAGGGAVAFHRRADAIRRDLPAAGLTDVGFLRRLRPLVASVGDGHTAVGPAGTADLGPRLWIGWDVVQDVLYVAKVYRDPDRPLLGSRLLGADGVPIAELRRRMRDLAAGENDYDNLVRLAGALRSPALLAELLGWEVPPEHVHVEIQHAGGSPYTVAVPLAPSAPGPEILPAISVAVPPADAAGLGYGFAGDVALLRIDSMARYREAFEFARTLGHTAALGEHLAAVARAALGGADPPAGVDDRIGAVPSATETLRDLFAAMRERKTAALIVDVRGNTGGNSLLALMLGYFLRGAEALERLELGYQVPRYSALYRANYPGAVAEDGYDFSEEIAWRLGRIDRRAAIRAFAAPAPTFARELEAGTWAAAWSPRVVALTSAFTYSAGYDVIRILYRLGAELVGVPSGQAGNCFMDDLSFTLPRSRLRGGISFKWGVAFPDDPAMGRVLRPARELTYADLAAMDFDPEAALRVALDLLAAG